MKSGSENDTAALVEFLTHHRAELLQRIGRKIPEQMRRHFGPEEVLQEVVLMAHQYKPTFRAVHDRQALRYVLFAAHQRLIRMTETEMRKKRGGGRNVELGERSAVALNDPADQQRSPSSAVARSEAVATLLSSLHMLPHRQAEMLRLHFLQGMEYATIAKKVSPQTTPEGVRLTIYRALQNLGPIQWEHRHHA